MPLYDDALPNDVVLEEKLFQLADQYGPESFMRKIHQLLPTKSVDSMHQYDEVLLEIAALHYFESDTYQSLAASSRQAYKYEINMFLRHCLSLKGSSPSLKEVTTAVFLSEYLVPVQKRNTRNKKAAFLRSFLGESYAHFFNSDISKLKRVLSIEVDQSREPRAFTKEQLKEIEGLIRLGREAHRNFTIFWTFLGSGIRLSELVHLQIGDINSSLQEIKVRGKGKRGNKQSNKIIKPSLEVLISYVNFRYQAVRNDLDYNERYIFSDDKGRSPLDPNTIQKMLSTYIEVAKSIPDSDKKPYQFSVHSLRHSFALYLFEGGADVYKIKELLRHQWLSSTEVYLKFYDGTLIKAIDQHPLAHLKVSELIENKGVFL